MGSGVLADVVDLVVGLLAALVVFGDLLLSSVSRTPHTPSSPTLLCFYDTSMLLLIFQML